MLGATGGELAVVAFVVITVVSAPWWPRLGEWIALRLSGGGPSEGEPPDQ